jgi:hypothetical protein
MTRYVEESFVDGKLLDEFGDFLEDRHHLAGFLAILAVASGQDDQLGAQLEST